MHYLAAISWTTNKKKQESPFQLVLNKELVKKFGKDAAVEWLYDCALFEVRDIGEYGLILSELKERWEFLDYQYYRHKGNEREFISFVEHSVYGAEIKFANWYKADSMLAALFEIRKKEVMEWVEEKKVTLKTATSGQRSKSKIKKFEDLFIRPEYLEKFLASMPKDIITEDGVFIGYTKRVTEIKALINALGNKGYIYKVNVTATTSMFCDRFKVKMADGTKRTNPYYVQDLVPQYQKLLPTLVKV